MPSLTDHTNADQFNTFGADFLPGLLGVKIVKLDDSLVEAELAVRKNLMAPNGFLHTGTVVTLADTCCGYGCVRALPEGRAGLQPSN